MSGLRSLIQHLPVATALRQTLREGYDWMAFRRDLPAGITLGIIAVPLSMALAIASGVPPQHGLYTAIVAGVIVAVLGGSRFSVTGPTAAFVVILYPIASRYGLSGLLLATLMAGCVLLLMGATRMGTLVQYIPHPVTTGFTAGIAVVIATLQIPDLLGLQLDAIPEHFTERLRALVLAVPELRWGDAAIGLFTLTVLIVWPRLKLKLPGPLAALILATLGGMLIGHFWPGAAPETIGTRFFFASDGVLQHGVPAVPPTLVWPWQAGAELPLSWQLIRELLGPALTIAMLAAIESLLCAVVADGLTGTRHDPDAELVALGIGNIVAPFFGGIAATGAIARTAANVRSGARTPFAAVIHSLFILLVLVSLAKILNLMPMAALAALLLMVAWNMSELDRISRIIRIGPKSDVAVLLACFALTVFFDMVLAVGVGVVLAALLFMRRMAGMTRTRALKQTSGGTPAALPPGVIGFHISGPLFFGAADKAASAIQLADPDVRAVIIDMSDVPVMDVTGAVALEAAIQHLRKRGVKVILAGVTGQPRTILNRTGIRSRRGQLRITHSVERAIALVAANRREKK